MFPCLPLLKLSIPGVFPGLCTNVGGQLQQVGHGQSGKQYPSCRAKCPQPGHSSKTGGQLQPHLSHTMSSAVRPGFRARNSSLEMTLGMICLLAKRMIPEGHAPARGRGPVPRCPCHARRTGNPLGILQSSVGSGGECASTVLAVVGGFREIDELTTVGHYAIDAG